MNNLEEKRIAMSSMIEDWRKSCKSKKRYCLDNGINEAKFHYWFKRINQGSAPLTGFISIEKPSGVKDIELVYPNGVKLRVDADLSLLSRLIHLY